MKYVRIQPIKRIYIAGKSHYDHFLFSYRWYVYVRINMDGNHNWNLPSLIATVTISKCCHHGYDRD